MRKNLTALLLFHNWGGIEIGRTQAFMLPSALFRQSFLFANDLKLTFANCPFLLHIAWVYMGAPADFRTIGDKNAKFRHKDALK